MGEWAGVGLVALAVCVSDIWQGTCDTQHVKLVVWHVTPDMWHLTHDIYLHTYFLFCDLMTHFLFATYISFPYKWIFFISWESKKQFHKLLWHSETLPAICYEMLMSLLLWKGKLSKTKNYIMLPKYEFKSYIDSLGRRWDCFESSG